MFDIRNLAQLVSGAVTEGRDTPLDFTLSAPQLVIPANQQAAIQITISTAFDFLAAGVKGIWNHTNWRIELRDADGRALQTAPVRGPLVVGEQQIIRPFLPLVAYRGGANLTGTVYNIDPAVQLTLDLAFPGIALW